MKNFTVVHELRSTGKYLILCIYTVFPICVCSFSNWQFYKGSIIFGLLSANVKGFFMGPVSYHPCPRREDLDILSTTPGSCFFKHPPPPWVMSLHSMSYFIPFSYVKTHGVLAMKRPWAAGIMEEDKERQRQHIIEPLHQGLKQHIGCWLPRQWCGFSLQQWQESLLE